MNSDSTTTIATTPTVSLSIVNQVSDLHRDVQYIHQRLKTMSALLRPHVDSTEMVDPIVRAHFALLRARSILREALDHVEGE